MHEGQKLKLAEGGARAAPQVLRLEMKVESAHFQDRVGEIANVLREPGFPVIENDLAIRYARGSDGLLKLRMRPHFLQITAVKCMNSLGQNERGGKSARQRI